MKSENESLLLRVKETEPTVEVIENALDKALFSVYKEIIQTCTDDFSLDHQWRFYKDGKSWLCKVFYKKKTVLWLSVWENYIKTAFYFTEKTRNGVLELSIDSKIKDAFSAAKPVGKLMPLVIDIDQHKQIEDLKKLIKYKKELK